MAPWSLVIVLCAVVPSTVTYLVRTQSTVGTETWGSTRSNRFDRTICLIAILLSLFLFRNSRLALITQMILGAV